MIVVGIMTIDQLAYVLTFGVLYVGLALMLSPDDDASDDGADE